MVAGTSPVGPIYSQAARAADSAAAFYNYLIGF